MKFFSFLLMAFTFVMAETTLVVKVKGITCSTDLVMIADGVKKISGVSSCEVKKQGPTTTFEIVFDAALTSKETIVAAIESTGSCENPDTRPYKVKL